MHLATFYGATLHALTPHRHQEKTPRKACRLHRRGSAVDELDSVAIGHMRSYGSDAVSNHPAIEPWSSNRSATFAIHVRVGSLSGTWIDLDDSSPNASHMLQNIQIWQSFDLFCTYFWYLFSTSHQKCMIGNEGIYSRELRTIHRQTSLCTLHISYQCYNPNGPQYIELPLACKIR